MTRKDERRRLVKAEQRRKVRKKVADAALRRKLANLGAPISMRAAIQRDAALRPSSSASVRACSAGLPGLGRRR